MSNAEERKQYPWELWFLFWIGIAIIAVTIGLIGLYYLRWPMFEWLWKLLFDEYIDPQQSNYLFSATAQVLGALFALVFSITLIAVQFVTKYTHETMKIIFNWRLIFYMAGFACSVILPLWWLLNPTELGTYISIITGSLVVLSLILLFLDLKKRMNIKWALDYLEEKAMKEVDEMPDTKREVNKPAERKITAIDNIAMGAYGDHNYEVFRLAEIALTRFAWQLENKCKELEEDSTQKALHDFVFRMLSDTCKETIDNPRAPFITISHVGKMGVKTIEKNLLQTEIAARNVIVVVARLCARDSTDTRIRLSIQCFTSLIWMVEKHPPNAPLTDTVRGALTIQEHYIFDLLEIHDIHLRKGWQDWLEWLLRTIVQFIPRYKPSEEVSKEVLVNIWLTDARFEEPNTGWLYNLLEENGIIEDFLREELFNSAVEKGKKLEIQEDRLKARWNAFQKYNDWRKGRLGNVGPPEE